MPEGQEPTITDVTGQEPTQTPPAAPQVGSAGGGWLETLPTEAQEYIRQLRDEAAKHRTNAQTLKTQLQGIEDDQLKANQKWEELAQKRQDRIAELEGQLASQALAMLRVKVAQEVGLPAELAERLQGDDEKALKKDAEAMLKLLKPAGGDGLGTPQARQAPGASRQTPTTRGQSRRLTL